MEQIICIRGSTEMTFHQFNRQIDDVLDLTREYHNLLMRGDDHFVWDSGLLSTNDTPYLLDDLGSPMRFGNEVYAFDEFGNNLHENTLTQPFGFTGYQVDPVANNYFAQARQYDASMGRFISEDLVNGLAAAPFTLNSYAYCWNQPMNLVDSDGLWPRWVRNAANNVGDFVSGVAATAVAVVCGLAAATVAVVCGAVGAVVGGVAGGVYGLVTDGFSGMVDGAVSGARDGFRNGAIYGAIVSAPLIAVGAVSLYHGATLLGPIFYNDCRDTALNSTFSNYRGQWVIRHDLGGLMEGNGMSFGRFMFVGENTGETLFLHEHGHFREYQILGFTRFMAGIGIPSILNFNNRDWMGDLHYNNQPWEINAEIFGGVLDRNNGRTNQDIMLGGAYFAYLYLMNGSDGWAHFAQNYADIVTHQDFSAFNKAVQ